MADLDERPPDDAFVRTAIRGMQIPDHDPDFWDRLAGGLDDVDEELELEQGRLGAVGAPGALDGFDDEGAGAGRAGGHRPRHVAQARAHRRAPLRAAPAPVVDGGGHRPPDDRAVRAGGAAGVPGTGWVQGQVHVEAPTASVPAASAARPTGGGGRTVVRAVADPLSRFTIEHDPATLPRAMRRGSNAVLLALALVAVVVVLVAGLSLVRQRSDSGATVPQEEPTSVSESGGGVAEDAAA